MASGYWRHGFWHQSNLSLTASTSNLTRNQLIEMAYRDIGFLAEGETLSAEALDNGLKKLNLYIRQLDVRGIHLWAVSAPTTLALTSNQLVYDSGNSTTFPLDILELLAASYHDAQENDTPLEIASLQTYEARGDKSLNGNPQGVFLLENKDLTAQSLYVFPAPLTVTTESIRLWYQRPLADFNAADDNPDLPTQWTRHLEYQLASDLSSLYGVPLDQRGWLQAQADIAYAKIFRSTMPNANDHHNRVSYL